MVMTRSIIWVPRKISELLCRFKYWFACSIIFSFLLVFWMIQKSKWNGLASPNVSSHPCQTSFACYFTKRLINYLLFQVILISLNLYRSRWSSMLVHHVLVRLAANWRHYEVEWPGFGGCACLLTLVLNYVVFIYLLQVNFLKFSQFSLDAFLA